MFLELEGLNAYIWLLGPEKVSGLHTAHVIVRSCCSEMPGRDRDESEIRSRRGECVHPAAGSQTPDPWEGGAKAN